MRKGGYFDFVFEKYGEREKEILARDIKKSTILSMLSYVSVLKTDV